MAIPAYSASQKPSLRGTKPLLQRAYSEIEPDTAEVDDLAAAPHLRHKSTSMNVSLARLSVSSEQPFENTSRRDVNSRRRSSRLSQGLTSPNSPKIRKDSKITPESFTPPSTPTKSGDVGIAGPEILQYDFSRLDYEMERARKLGSGLWSNVYLAEPTVSSPVSPRRSILTPPATPHKSDQNLGPSVYAVKVPARKDSLPVFSQEAKMLTSIQRSDGANQYIVPFYGQDPRNSALVFEAVIGGSLEDLIKRLSHMTEVSRHLELVNIFPRLAHDLISGLDFVHNTASVIHADVKPANILLDISDHYSLPAPVIRARYIDFSAAFPATNPELATNAGGTWTFMAPEQLRIQKDLSTPTMASDVWSLGITLLSVIVLGSPYSVACGDNAFMLREAIKSGDPLGFARMDPVAQKRMQACQEFIDCCKLALLKDREKRTSAGGWREWLETRKFGAFAALV